MAIRYYTSGLYILVALGFALYSFVCGFQYCSLFAYLVPATPWVQLAGATEVDLPRVAIVIPYALNLGLFYGLGVCIEKLTNK